jgi:NOL1/NOP2/fmu family ribosome biogenesis protein
VAGFAGAPGLTAWEGRSFAPELERALRVWPHAHDTGGFFVAVLEKGEGAGAVQTPSGSGPGAFEEVADRERWLGPVVERFGFPEGTFEGLRLVRHGGKTLALVAGDLAPPVRPEPRSVGLAFLHATMRRPKMTTAAAMAFGASARRNVVDLDRARAEAYVAREDVEVGGSDAGTVVGDGYVIVRWQGVALGAGWFRGAPGGAGGSVRSLFPKRW